MRHLFNPFIIISKDMKTQLLLSAVLTIMFCLPSAAQSEDTDNSQPSFPDTTLVKGESINIYRDTVNLVNRESGSGAFGNNNAINSTSSFAFGERNTVARRKSNVFIVGADNAVSGSHSVCIGRSNDVASDGSFAAGRHLSLSGTSPLFVIGEGLADDARLAPRVPDGLAVGFLSTKPTLTVTASPNDYVHQVTDRTGMVGIGDVTPTAKLHVRSDDGEDAVLFLEPAQPSSSIAQLRLRDNTHRLTVDAAGTMLLTANSHPLNLKGSNIEVTGNTLELGAASDPRLVLSTQGAPALYSNALPDQNLLLRDYDSHPSYAMVFGDQGLALRTAAYQLPRDMAPDEITNWRDALLVGIDGTVTLNGKVGVNAVNTTQDYALAVDGGILTTKVFVMEATDWPDYVFDEGYPRMPLGELETYLRENRHLPGVPSAEEMRERGGADLAETQTLLLRKIEELTLYTLEQQKLIEELRELGARQQRLLDALTAGDTVRFAYDACGNRTGRTLEFGRMDGGGTGDGDPGKPEEWCAELRDSFQGGEVTLSPNPTEGRFTLSLSGEIPSRATATLLTLTGAVLEERAVNGPAEEFDLGAQPAGMYLLRLAAGKETGTWKIVKRK